MDRNNSRKYKASAALAPGDSLVQYTVLIRWGLIGRLADSRRKRMRIDAAIEDQESAIS